MNHGPSVFYLEGSSLSLCFQDVTLQILWGAQWSDNWTIAPCTAQSTLLCELHHILLQKKDCNGHTQRDKNSYYF